jgi:hypothetical protein
VSPGAGPLRWSVRAAEAVEEGEREVDGEQLFFVETVKAAPLGYLGFEFSGAGRRRSEMVQISFVGPKRHGPS